MKVGMEMDPWDVEISWGVWDEGDLGYGKFVKKIIERMS